MWERRAATTPLTAPPTAPPPAPSTTTPWTPGIEGEMSPVDIESFFEIFYFYWVTYQDVDLGRGVLPDQLVATYCPGRMVEHPKSN